MKFEIQVQDLEPIQAMIGLLIQRGAKMKPFMRQAGEIMRASVTRNFEAEGRPSRWKALSPITREIYEGQAVDRLQGTKGYQNLKRESTRRRHEQAAMGKVGGRKLLHGQGDLKKSIVLGRITDTSAEVGSPLPYARIHQKGGTIVPRHKKALCIPMGGEKFLYVKKVTIPAREYLLLQKEDEITITRALDHFMLGGLSDA